MTVIPHGFPDSTSAGLRPICGDSASVLILGSYPGRQSLLKKEYYGNMRNHFWQIIEILFHIDRNLPYNVRTSRLTEYGIALWDVIRTCNRAGSADNRIRDPVFNNISGFLESTAPVHLVVLNGSAAGQYYRMLKIPLPVPWIVLPSTSPANTRYTLEEKIRAWEIIRTSCFS
jgi:hypoxanthine-DNA glycosylase